MFYKGNFSEDDNGAISEGRVSQAADNLDIDEESDFEARLSWKWQGYMDSNLLNR